MSSIIGRNLNKSLVDITDLICYVGKRKEKRKKRTPDLTFSCVRSPISYKHIYILAKSGKKSRRVCLRKCDKSGKILLTGGFCYV